MGRRFVVVGLIAVATLLAGVATNLVSNQFTIAGDWRAVGVMLGVAGVGAIVATVLSQSLNGSNSSSDGPSPAAGGRYVIPGAVVAIVLAIAAFLVDPPAAVDTPNAAGSSSEAATTAHPGSSAARASGPGGASPCPLQRAPAAMAGPTPTSLDDLPAGWRPHLDAKGFCVGRPAAWALRGSSDEIHTFFDDPGKTRTLEVSQNLQPTTDPVTDFQNKVKRHQYPHDLQGCVDYDQVLLDQGTSAYLVTIRSGDVVTAASANWEFTCSLAGRRRHVFYRNFVTAPGSQAYAIVWYTDDSEAAHDRADFQVVLHSFIGAR